MFSKGGEYLQLCCSRLSATSLSSQGHPPLLVVLWPRIRNQHRILFGLQQSDVALQVFCVHVLQAAVYAILPTERWGQQIGGSQGAPTPPHDQFGSRLKSFVHHSESGSGLGCEMYGNALCGNAVTYAENVVYIDVSRKFDILRLMGVSEPSPWVGTNRAPDILHHILRLAAQLQGPSLPLARPMVSHGL